MHQRENAEATKIKAWADGAVFSTHGVAGLLGGLLVGILGNPNMLVYIGTEKDAPGVNVTGWLYGNFNQFLLQIYAALFIIVLNVFGTYVILKVVSAFVALRMDDTTLQIGDDAVHGGEAYALDGYGQRTRGLVGAGE